MILTSPTSYGEDKRPHTTRERKTSRARRRCAATALTCNAKRTSNSDRLIDVSRSQEFTLANEKERRRGAFIEKVINSNKDQVAIASGSAGCVYEQALTRRSSASYRVQQGHGFYDAGLS